MDKISVSISKLCDNIVIVTSDVNNAEEVERKVEQVLAKITKTCMSPKGQDPEIQE